MLDNWGVSKLGKVFYDLSIDEMKDADALINRILMYDGHPNLQKLNSITVGEAPQEMLTLAFESEKAAVAQFNAGAKECHELGDHGTAATFEEMVLDEERHADFFESQLDAISQMGIQQYLAQQQDGDRTVRKELRAVLKKYTLPVTGPLFDNAYAYVAENY